MTEDLANELEIFEKLKFLSFPKDIEVYDWVGTGNQYFYRYPPTSLYAYCSFVFTEMLYDHSNEYLRCLDYKP